MEQNARNPFKKIADKLHYVISYVEHKHHPALDDKQINLDYKFNTSGLDQMVKTLNPDSLSTLKFTHSHLSKIASGSADTTSTKPVAYMDNYFDMLPPSASKHAGQAMTILAMLEDDKIVTLPLDVSPPHTKAGRQIIFRPTPDNGTIVRPLNKSLHL